MRPEFGHQMRKFFDLDTGFTNLNNGTFGSLPTAVRESYSVISRQVEQSPDSFIRKQLPPGNLEVRTRLAKMINADVDECVIVPSVSHGINVILNNIKWEPGDTLIHTNLAFDTIKRSIECLSYPLNTSPNISIFQLTFPASHQSILAHFRVHVRGLRVANPGKKVVAQFDTIISTPGVLMPWRDMVKICREEGVLSIVDAAHSLGQEPGINLHGTDPDFWVGNCNKWLYAKRGCALLYVPKRNQHIIHNNIPPGMKVVIPGNSVSRFVSEFQWNGSTDVVTALTIRAGQLTLAFVGLSVFPIDYPEALDFRTSIGGENAIMTYCHDLAMTGGRRMATIFDTQMMDSPAKEGELVGCMVNVELPLSEGIKPTPSLFMELDKKLLGDWKVYATPFYHNEKWWIRASAQVYNEMSDFEYLASALRSICKEIEQETPTD
ncbi:hypothetical protein D9758_004330 [Tetrapyrgos nigripes]|uniref:Aminotransferase class V domain-containing protein n=1 Tax=Tetrapyrgos nigripes TaxID=182062 RepID=A0A8H5GN92_9AGAR|nr:hypothetical protein D9758_004330 [Tetrapyrgos nigripes]